MTDRDRRIDLPVADATGSAQFYGAGAAISGGARGQSNTWQIDTTESYPGRSDWRRLQEANLAAEEQARQAWVRVKAAVTADSPDAWRLICARVEALRGAADASVAAMVLARCVAGDSASEFGSYPGRVEKYQRGVRNRAVWWQRKFADKGGTPQADAVLWWSRLLADVKKAYRFDLDVSGVWLRVRDDLDGLRTEVAALAGEVAR